jgi:hypothetical protein
MKRLVRKLLAPAIFMLPALGLQAGSAAATPVQWAAGAGGNDHWYDYVSRGGTFDEARQGAAALSYLGLQGYLATVTSQAENDFITGFVTTQTAFIGLSDAVTEGTWLYTDGPEAGQVAYTTGGGTQIFSFWSPGEPNDNGNEDAALINWGGDGSWNDINVNWSFGYIVEYGGTTAPVPVPAAGLMLAGAISGLAALRRRRRG